MPPVSNKLKLMLFASDGAPVLIVLVTAVPPPIHSTKGVPLMVRLVVVPVVQIVLVVALFNTILPVPKLIVRTLALLELNRPVVSVKVESANVPAVSVVVSVESNVTLSCKVQVPLVPLNVIGLLIVIALVLIFTDVVAENVIAPVVFQTVAATVDQLPLTLSVGVVPF